MKLHILMIDAHVKAYPDPARSKRMECIAQAYKIATEEGHEFELMQNTELQQYFDEPIWDMDYGPVLTFARIGDPLRWRKASYIPNLLYLDTDVFLNYIPEMKPGRPYLAQNGQHFIIGVNDCCEKIKEMIRTPFLPNSWYEFPADSYEHYNLSAERIAAIGSEKLRQYYTDPEMTKKNTDKPWMTWIEGENVQFGRSFRIQV